MRNARSKSPPELLATLDEDYLARVAKQMDRLIWRLEVASGNIECGTPAHEGTDVVQYVASMVLEGRARCRDPERFRGFFYRVCSVAARKLYRQSQLIPFVSLKAADQALDTSPLADRLTSDHEEAVLIQKVLMEVCSPGGSGNRVES